MMSNRKDWFIKESPGLKPDWLEEINSFAMKNSNKLFWIKRSKILPQIGSRDTGRGVARVPQV